MNNRYFGYNYPNRTVCAVLDEMRKCFESRNFSPILGLIEEIQIMANRMEAGLSDKKDLEDMQEDRKRMNSELMDLQKDLDATSKLLTIQKNLLKEMEERVAKKSASSVDGAGS